MVSFKQITAHHVKLTTNKDICLKLQKAKNNVHSVYLFHAEIHFHLQTRNPYFLKCADYNGKLNVKYPNCYLHYEQSASAFAE